MASYTAETQYKNGSGGDYVYIKLVWSYTNTATTATIKASLFVKRDPYGPTAGADQYWISLNGTKFVNASGYHTIGTSYQDEDHPICSGSTTINLTNSGASATSLTLDAYYNNSLSDGKLLQLRVNPANYSGWYWNASLCSKTSGWAVTASIPAQASACTAPTTITLKSKRNGSLTSESIVMPSGTINVAWSGASGGTNNSITGYDIYYRLGSNPTTSSYTGKIPLDNYYSTSGNIDIQLSSATRESLIYVGIVTKCGNTAYYSSLKTGGGNLRVNDQPKAPTLNRKSPFTIKSSSSGLSVTATKGNTTYSIATPVVKYKKGSNSHSGESTFTTANLDAGTYYFWTYDGLEYSAATTLTIYKNSKPAVSSVGITSTPYIAKGETNTYVYKVLIGNIVTNYSSGKYTIRYQRTDKGWSSNNDVVASKSYSGSSTINANYTFEFEKYLPSTVSKDYDFNFAVQITVPSDEGEEKSLWYYCGTDGTEGNMTYYKYAGLWANATLSSDPLPAFSATIKNDERMTSWTCTAKRSDDSTLSVTKFKPRESDNNLIFDVETADAPGITVTYTITATNGTITKTKSFTRTLRQKTVISSISFSNTTMNAFGSSDNTGVVKISGTRGNDLNASNTEATIYAVKGSSSESTTRKIIISASAGASFTDIESASISVSDFFSPPDKTLGIALANRYGTTTYYFKVTFTNKYGESIEATTGNCTLNFDKSPAFNTAFSTEKIKYKNSSTGSYSTLNTHYIQKDQILQFGYDIINYTYRKLTIQVERATDDEGANSIVVATQELAASSVASNATSRIITNVITNTYTVSELVNAKYYWRLVVIQDGTGATISSSWVPTNAVLHTTPIDFSISTITSNSNNYVVKFSCADLGIRLTSGATTSASVQLQYNNGTSWSNFGNTVSLTGSSTSINTTVTISGAVLPDTKSFRLLLTTSVSNANSYIAASINTSSNIVIVYGEEPTVSYRKNQIGINNKAPAGTAVIDIATASSKENIYIRKGTTIMLKVSFTLNSDNTITTIFDM